MKPPINASKNGDDFSDVIRSGSMSVDPPDLAPDHIFYATVGELVLLSTTIDALLNTLLIEAFHCGESAWLDPIIATLDTARKSEILKNHAKTINYAKMSKPITEFIDQVEIVMKQRNIVCHTPPTFEDGEWGFRPTALAKILRKSNTYRPQMIRESRDNLRAAIATGEAALQAGSELVAHYKKFNAEQVGYYKRLNSKRGRRT